MIELSISSSSSYILMISKKNGEIDVQVQQIQSHNNLVDLLIKVLPSTTLKKLRYNIKMQRLNDLQLEALKKT